MLITPDSTIFLLKNVPLDSAYDHTIYFDTVEAQTEYFKKFKKYAVLDSMYQRPTSDTMKVEFKVEDLYDCNYMMFQNTSFGDKWFYAFVKMPTYINPITSSITFEIDDMQTWLFDYTLGECFVEREHTKTDRIGENTLPEDVEKGPYIVTSSKRFDMEPDVLTIYATRPPDNEDPFEWIPPHFDIANKHAVPCYTKEFPYTVDGGNALKKTIDDFNNQTIGGRPAGDVINVFATKRAHKRNIDIIPDIKAPYKPRNKKLLSYPYIACLLVGSGNAVELRYELLNSNTCTMCVPEGVNATAICCPNYAGLEVDFNNAVYISGYPTLAWKTDTYGQWAARRGPELLMNTAVTAGTAALAGMFGVALGPVSAAALATYSLASGVANIVKETYHAKRLPDSINGAIACADAMIGLDRFAFHGLCSSITAEYAARIDDYFDRFGYKVATVKVPNRNARRCWTYTKTAGCEIYGSLPQDARKHIAHIYDNGITFWNSSVKIGDYTQDNTV